jgi:hypothetical protein
MEFNERIFEQVRASESKLTGHLVNHPTHILLRLYNRGAPRC